MVVFLGATIVFASVLITCITLAAPQWAEAATNSTTHQSVPAAPQCMRRVTVASKPCGATIYIDDIEVGRTPMSFPMPLGRYTLVLFAPGHQPYGQRILVQDAPLQIDVNLVPLP
jgi:PEGA domain